MNLNFLNVKLKFLIIFILTFVCFAVNGEEKDFHSSIVGLEELLKTEVVLFQETEIYINSLLEHIDTIKSELASIKKEHVSASKDLEGYLNNPIHAYRLIKRLHTDWLALEDTINTEPSRTYFLEAFEFYRENLSFPSHSDLFGSAMALSRLQETYKLDVAQIASGILNGIKYGSSMSWQDCLQLGQHLFTIRDFNNTIPWFKQSMAMLIESDFDDGPLSLDLMETVAGYHQEMGDIEYALSLTKFILNNDPEREHLQATKLYLEQMLSDGIKTGLIYDTLPIKTDYALSNEFKLYEKVCRAELTLTPKEERLLYCKYTNKESPYHILHPFKMEVHYLDPEVVQFHDVIGEREIKTLKRLSKTKMSRSEVRSKDGMESMPASYRTSKSAWFDYSTHRYMTKMLHNVADFSGLRMDRVEPLQVANYGIGGHYEPHWDFFLEDNSFDASDGNRVATAVHYLSDVEEGGATAFPFLNIAVKPKKGSVLFWYNLHSSDDPDYRTKHAACPVIKGSKWIANIWVRVRGQESVRPCGLKREHEISLIYKDYD